MLEENKNYKQYTIAEMSDGIILTNFEKNLKVKENSYQNEAELERQLIENLVSQGYERLIVKTNKDLYSNLKIQIERLNNIHFSDNEWNRFLTEYLDSPNEGMIEKTRKIQENHIHDFIFDNGVLKNIKIIDKKIYTIILCKLQVKFGLKVHIIIDMM